MSDERAKVDRQQEKAAARGTQRDPEATPETVTYSFDEMSENAPQLLGVSRHALAGAFHEESQKKRYSLDEAKGLVDAFLKREVGT